MATRTQAAIFMACASLWVGNALCNEENDKPVTPIEQVDHQENVLARMLDYMQTLTPEQQQDVQNSLLNAVTRGTSVEVERVGVDTPKPHLTPQEKLKQESRTIYMVPTNAFRSFLPHPFQARYDIPWYLLWSCIVGSTIGVPAYMMVSRMNEKGMSWQQAGLATLPGIVSALVTGLLMHFVRVKDEDTDITEFITYKWPDLREKLSWPDHMREILNYLAGRMDDGTFDIEEARSCLQALNQHSSFD